MPIIRLYFGRKVAAAAGDTITVDSAALTLAGQDITSRDAELVTVAAAALTLTGQSVTEHDTVGITAANLPLAGQTIGIVDAEAITAGSLTFSGSAITVSDISADTVTIDSGTLALSGTCLDPFFKSSVITLSADKLTATNATGTGAAFDSVLSTDNGGATKLYAEARLIAIGGIPNSGFTGIGVANSAFSLSGGLAYAGTGNTVGYYDDGSIWTGDAPVDAVTNIDVNDWVAIAVDLDADTVAFRNVTAASAWSTPLSISGLTGPYRFAISTAFAGDSWTANFDGFFVGAMPAGYTRWDDPPQIGVVDREAITAAALSLAGQNITVTDITADTVPVGSAALTLAAQTIGVIDVEPIATANLSLAGSAITTIDAEIVAVASVSLTLTGQAITERDTVGITAANLPLAGQTIGITDTETISAGALTLTGQTITVTETERVAVTSAMLLLSGQAVSELETTPIIVAALLLTGSDIAVNDVSAATVTIEAASLILTGSDIGIIDPVVPVEPPVTVAPSPGGSGTRAGRPLYKRLKLKKKKRREELEELLEIVRNLPAPQVPPQIPQIPQTAQSLLDGVPRISSPQIRFPDADEDEDEIALLLEVL